jgi:hypothetical protein
VKLSHKIRAHLLKREADALLKRAARPYQPSIHLVSRVPEQKPDHRFKARYAVLALAALLLVVVVNLEPEPQQMLQCSPTVGKMT